MKGWRLKYWWQRQCQRFRIYYVLGHDQCWHGFRHTRDELLNWLAACTLEAQIDLHAELGKQIEELKTFRGRGL